MGSDSISIPEHLWAVVIGAKGARIRGFEDKCERHPPSSRLCHISVLQGVRFG